jgi:hypothetical protein
MTWAARNENGESIHAKLARLISALEDGYLLALKIPPDHPVRFQNDATLAEMRDAIAEATGNSAENVQNYYEGLVNQHDKR